MILVQIHSPCKGVLMGFPGEDAVSIERKVWDRITWETSRLPNDIRISQCHSSTKDRHGIETIHILVFADAEILPLLKRILNDLAPITTVPTSSSPE